MPSKNMPGLCNGFLDIFLRDGGVSSDITHSGEHGDAVFHLYMNDFRLTAFIDGERRQEVAGVLHDAAMRLDEPTLPEESICGPACDQPTEAHCLDCGCYQAGYQAGTEAEREPAGGRTA